jgi:hypothetical protein
MEWQFHYNEDEGDDKIYAHSSQLFVKRRARRGAGIISFLNEILNQLAKNADIRNGFLHILRLPFVTHDMLYVYLLSTKIACVLII